MMRALNKKFQYPDNRVGYYMPTFDLLTLEVFPRFEEELDKIKIKHKANKSRYYIDIEGKGQILFRSMDRPEKIVSYQHGDCIIDELDTLPEDKARAVFEKILGRNRQQKADGSPNTTGIVTTPEGFRYIYRNWHQDKPDASYQIIRASTRDNPHINLSYVKTLLSQYTPEQQKAYIEGYFVNLTSGTVYKYFDRARNNSIESVIDVDGYKETLYVGSDFNIGGCVNVIAVERASKYHFVDEIVTYDTYDTVEQLKSKYAGHEIIIYPDASGQNRKTNATRSDVQILREHFEVVVDNSNPAVKDRVTSVNSSFMNYNIFVSVEKCPKLTQALEQHAYDPKTEAPQKFDTHPSVDDYTEALGYLVAKLFPIHRPKSNISRLSQTPIKY